MSDRLPSRELEDLLKKQSRSAKDWAYSIAGAFWEVKGQLVDEEYLFACLANAMMSMHHSIFNKEVKELEQTIQQQKEEIERLRKDVKHGCSICATQPEITIKELEVQLKDRNDLIKESIPYVYKVRQYCSDHWDINMGKWLEKANKITKGER